MEPRANYFIVGLFVVSLSVVATVCVWWFSAGEHTAHSTYLIYLNESVSGLSVQASVKFNGVDVGTVTDIQLNIHDPQQVRLTLSIEDSTPINQSTRASLMAQGITGVMFVGLKAGAAQAPPLRVKPGERHPVIASDPSVLVQLDTAVREMSDDMHRISAGFQELLNDHNQQAVHQTLQHVAKISRVLADRSKEMDDSLKGLDATLKDSRLLVQNFSQQALPSMLNTLNQFNTLLNQLEPFASTLQDNPSALLRGKAVGALGPGE